MSDRESEIKAFLKAAGWSKADRTPVPGDASTRSYERLTLGARKAVLMNAPKGAEAPSEPVGASAADRKALGYNALARLAGPNIEAFACIANELKLRGFSAPEIYAADLDAGLMLLEDFGDAVYARVIENDPTSERELYESAVDTLAAIYRSSFPQEMSFKDATWRVREYDDAAMMAEVDLLPEWFAPYLGVDLSDQALSEWQQIWEDLFVHLKAHPPGLALRDFHAENLFWLEDREGTANVGLIDFQDALFAHPFYDLTSLLDDARRDVPYGLRGQMKNRFCEKAGIKDEAPFDTAYRVQSIQRNAKILGIFARLAKRDGKPEYLNYIPRVVKNFWRCLYNPEFHPLESWMRKYLPQILEQKPQIKTAMVLAAGHGTRMRPLTNDRAKAMVEVGGKPLIDHMLDRLAEAGVERAVVNVHAHADHLEAHLKKRKGLPEIIISDEREELLETGGGVVKALPLLGEDPIFICNIDAIWTEDEDSNLDWMMKHWDPAEMDDFLLLAPIERTLGYNGKGDFNRIYDGYLHRRYKTQDQAPYVYAGVQIAKIGPMKSFTVEPFSRNKMWDISLEKRTIFGHDLRGFWMHVGDPQAREEAEAVLKEAGD